MKLDKELLLAGITGPVLFAIVILISGMMYPNYNHIDQAISELGAVDSPSMNIMNVFGFILMGVSFILFAIGFYNKKGDSGLGKLIALLFILGGVGMILVGMYPCDARCENVSETGLMHNFVTPLPLIPLFPAFVLLMIDVTFVRPEPSMKYYIVISGILGLLITYYSFQWLTYSVPTGGGLTQRIAIGLPFFLLAYTAWKMYGIKK